MNARLKEQLRRVQANASRRQQAVRPRKVFYLEGRHRKAYYQRLEAASEALQDAVELLASCGVTAALTVDIPEVRWLSKE